MQLTTYTQILRNGKQNLKMKPLHPNDLMMQLRQEIESLAEAQYQQSKTQLQTEQIFGQMLDTWPIPVCLFNNKLELTYRNTAMNLAIEAPLLIGTNASQLGFTFKKGVLLHAKFNQEWQSQTISYDDQNQGKEGKHWLFSAINVSKAVNQSQSTTQQKVIRVLAHEIRNSLTPMQSMTDTLLNDETLEISQTRLVLSRINERSKRLLSFIGKYSELSRLPSPKFEWFNCSALVQDARVTLSNVEHRLDYQGNELCYGDREQISQVMLNVLMNAKEANNKPKLIITIQVYSNSTQQVIKVTDNGTGFGNLENALTPFYTTKDNGSGIGLSLCAEIIRNHGGVLRVSNHKQGGANITMTWPLSH
jgi:nitrogen fixation/metabolism regulation signal transduction histidine kinase